MSSNERNEHAERNGTDLLLAARAALGGSDARRPAQPLRLLRQILCVVNGRLSDSAVRALREIHERATVH